MDQGVRAALTGLSQRPQRRWPAGAVHHGARVGVLVVLAVIAQVLFPAASVPDFPVLDKGMVAERDVIAQVGFPIYKSPEELGREQTEAASAVAPTFEHQPAAADTLLRRIRSFLTRVDSAAAPAAGELRVRAQLREVLASYGFAVTEEAVELLRSARQRTLLARSLEQAIRQELPAGFVPAADLEDETAPQLRLRRGGREELVARTSLLTAQRFYERAGRHLPRSAPPGLVELQRLVLIRFFEPSIRLDREETEATRARARQAVSTVKGHVVRGEKVVGAREQIRERELERLRAYRDELVRLGRLGDAAGSRARAAGAFLFNLLILLIFGLLVYFYRPAVYQDFRHVLVIAALILATVAISALLASSRAPPELIPIALPAMIVATLWDGRLALSLALVLAVLLAGQTPFLGSSVLFTLVIGGAAAALSVRVVRRRSQIWVFISIIAGAYLAGAASLGLLRSRELFEVFGSAGWGTLNAIGSALIAIGFLPLLEAFARITTDQSLLELTDLNRPLLRRLSMEAPGTYAHSISVANLAEAAARAVGANELLTRVGVYYHDIGKMLKPQYFVENQPQGRNPHDKLKPGTSAAIVRSHVVDGLRLAGEAKLPACVAAFIAEHHGTQPISFFFDQARELSPDAELDAGQFTYPGPKPQSKETAIAMLADTVESAARALPDPAPERIQELVDRLVDARVKQGELDETPLTLRDLARIKQQFVSVLAGMYHSRIDYPSGRDAGVEPTAMPLIPSDSSAPAG